MSSELDRKFSSLRQVFEDLVIKKAALKWNTTVFLFLFWLKNITLMMSQFYIAFLATYVENKGKLNKALRKYTNSLLNIFSEKMFILAEIVSCLTKLSKANRYLSGNPK